MNIYPIIKERPAKIKKPDCLVEYIDLSGEAKMRAVAQWKNFVNVDGSLDNVPSEDLIYGCQNSDYHFTPQGILYRDIYGNVM